MAQTSLRQISPSKHAVRSTALDPYYSELLLRLGWPQGANARGLETLALTSCYCGEGVTTVASHLAAVAAQSGEHRVLLVDANLASPGASRLFDLEGQPGLSELLQGDISPATAIHQTALPGLSVVPVGGFHAPQPWESAAESPDLVASLSNDFHLTVFDLPAAAEGSLAMRLAGLVDGVLLVIEAERVRWEVARHTQETLVRSGATLLGAVLNKRRQYVPGWLYRTL